jgi:hypothetical protein
MRLAYPGPSHLFRPLPSLATKILKISWMMAKIALLTAAIQYTHEQACNACITCHNMCFIYKEMHHWDANQLRECLDDCEKSLACKICYSISFLEKIF